MSEHEHDFEFQGIAAWSDSQPLPGTGACVMNYADAYYCRRCCEMVLKRERCIGNTYQPLRDGATLYTRKPA